MILTHGGVSIIIWVGVDTHGTRWKARMRSIKPKHLHCIVRAISCSLSYSSFHKFLHHSNSANKSFYQNSIKSNASYLVRLPLVLFLWAFHRTRRALHKGPPFVLVLQASRMSELQAYPQRLGGIIVWRSWRERVKQLKSVHPSLAIRFSRTSENFTCPNQYSEPSIASQPNWVELSIEEAQKMAPS